jgi:hypothetical protein
VHEKCVDGSAIKTIADLRKVELDAILKTIDPGCTPCVIVLGYHEPGDGGGGLFFWENSSAIEDFGTKIIPDPGTDPPPGHWKRIFDDPISVKWFGAKGNGSDFDTEPMQNAIRAVKPGGQLVIPFGIYKVSSLYIENSVSLQGIGKPKITSHDVSSTVEKVFAVITYDTPNKDLSGDIEIKNLEVEYTGGKKLDTSRRPIPVNGIFVNINGRLKCEYLDIHDASYCGILAVANHEIVLKHVYCHNNGYAGANFSGTGGVIALPGCRFENNGGGSRG